MDGVFSAYESDPTVATFRRLLGVASPPGYESRMADQVSEMIREVGFAPETDPAGNVLVRLDGAADGLPTMVLAAHMDEIAIVVTGIEPDGSLRMDRSGGLYPYKLGESPIDVLGDERTVTGVLSLGSTHSTDAANRVVKWADTRVFTGLTPEALRKAGVRIGSPAVPHASVRGPVLFGDPKDPLIGAWTFDDRMGVTALLRLLQRIHDEPIELRWPTIVAFTVHEEGGCHGAKVLAHRERPEVFVAVDGFPLSPGCGVDRDGGPVAWSKDMKANYDPRLLRALAAAANQAGTRLQTAVHGAAYSDASAVYDAGAAPRVATFGHSRDNSHGYEVARLRVFNEVVETLAWFLQTWK